MAKDTAVQDAVRRAGARKTPRLTCSPRTKPVPLSVSRLAWRVGTGGEQGQHSGQKPAGAGELGIFGCTDASSARSKTPICAADRSLTFAMCDTWC